MRIEGLAKALIERGTLIGDEVKEVFRASVGAQMKRKRRNSKPEPRSHFFEDGPRGTILLLFLYRLISSCRESLGTLCAFRY